MDISSQSEAEASPDHKLVSVNAARRSEHGGSSQSEAEASPDHKHMSS